MCDAITEANYILEQYVLRYFGPSCVCCWIFLVDQLFIIVISGEDQSHFATV